MALSASQKAKASKTLAKAKKQLQGIQKTKDAISAKGGFTKSGLSKATNSLRSINDKASGISRRLSSSKPIYPDSLDKTDAYQPPAAPEVVDYDFTANNQGFIGMDGDIATDGNFLTVVDPNDKYAALTQNQNTYQAQIERYMDEKPSGGDIMRDLERETGIKELRQRENDLTSQLNAITAKRDADQLGLEGQGRGITDTIIGGQQARIGREAAIQALPIQAQLAAAQGNVALAEAHINTWGTILMQDATNDFNFKKELLTSSKDFANTIQLSKIADLDKENERKFLEKKELINTKTAALSNALGQGAPESVSIAIRAATNQEEVVSALGVYNADLLAQEAQRASIAASQASTANAYDQINARKRAEQQAVEDAEKGILTPDQFKVATDLRKELNGLQFYKDAQDLEANVAGFLLAIDQADGTSDIAAINMFQRMVVDPGVAVREGDVALLQSAMSFTDQSVLKAQGLLVGKKLTPQAREQMKELAGGVYDARIAIVDENSKPIRAMSQEQGIDYGKYVGKSFATYDDIAAGVNPAQPVTWGVLETNSYLDSVTESLSKQPSANPWGVTNLY